MSARDSTATDKLHRAPLTVDFALHGYPVVQASSLLAPLLVVRLWAATVITLDHNLHER